MISRRAPKSAPSGRCPVPRPPRAVGQGRWWWTDSLLPRTLGSKVLATGKKGDFSLLELDQQPPAGSVLLGWSSSPIAFSNEALLFRISHPGGAPQAYSAHEVDTSRPTCTSWPRGERIYSTDLFGATEGGSSGSPVLNAGGQIVSQLSGACGFNVGDTCDSVRNATVDGALAPYFAKMPSGGAALTRSV